MKRVLIIIFLLVPSISFAQRYIYMNGIIGHYLMEDMRELQKVLVQDLQDSGIPAKAVLTFPASFQGEVGIDFTIRDRLLRAYTLGGFLNYTLTEGLISYSDYSGEMSIQQMITRIAIGARGSRSIGRGFAAYAKVAFSMSNLDIVSRTSLQNGASDEEDLGFSAAGLLVHPGVQWSKVYGRFAFTVLGGFEANLSGKTAYFEGYHLLDKWGNPARIDWTGFRLGVGTTFKL